FKTAPVQNRVVLITTDQQRRPDPDRSTGDLATIINKVHQLGGKNIALLTPDDFLAPAAADMTSSSNFKNSQIIIAAASTQQKIPATKSFPAASLLPAATPLPEPQQLLLARQNPLAQYRLNHPNNWNFLPAQFNIRQTSAAGHLIFAPDADGKIRTQSLLMPAQQFLIPSLPLQLAIAAENENLQKLQTIPPQLAGKLRTDKLRIPVIGYYRLLLDIGSKKRPFQTYTSSDLLQNKLKQNALEDKVVLIGPISSYGDRHQVANYGDMSTSELAALTTATLLANSATQRPNWAWLLETSILLYFTVLLVLLIPRLSYRAGLTTIILFLSAWIMVAAGALIVFAIWLKVVPAIIFGLGGFTLVRWHIGSRERYRQQQENYKTLAQRFQEQGLLDLALEKALLITPNNKSSKTMLYNLGLEFERKRMPHNATAVYQHLLQAGRFRDTKQRLQRLAKPDQTMIRSSNDNATVILNPTGEKPTLGRYRIESELGQGAMGTVYLGIDPKINRQVAIKTLSYQQIDGADLPQVKTRFFREAEAAGNLSHPNIVTIYDVGEEADLAFFAMELLEGKDLSHYCQPKQRLPVAQVIAIISQIAAALDYAHQQGVVHRDIKPANIILIADGQVKITDFGIARVSASTQTETGIILGTPSYMSPEQVAGKKVDGRSDLFSLGTVMYELLSGKKPFQGENLTALMYNISIANYQPLAKVCPKLPDRCYTIVDKLLQKTLTRRFKSTTKLQQELQALQNTLEK
ncbi:MAG: protein kinase, partial [Desulfuromonadales bacterium]|nr:protein kinase [Desulfuromonadales bacterium]